MVCDGKSLCDAAEPHSHASTRSDGGGGGGIVDVKPHFLCSNDLFPLPQPHGSVVSDAEDETEVSQSPDTTTTMSDDTTSTTECCKSART